MTKLLSKRWFIYLAMFLYVFIVVTLVSKCSFVYRMNDWVDVNCYFTVASAMKSGQVLYRDIYEQKGPYLYFVHLLAVIMFPHSYLGMYFIEVICGYVFAIFGYKMLSLFVKSEKRRLFWLIVLITSYYMSIGFTSGDSMEEIVVPLEMMAIYFALKSMKNKEDVKWYEMSLIGLAMGTIFLSKYVDIAVLIIIPFMLFVFNVKDKKVKSAFLYIPYYLLGFIIPFIPVVIYLGINHAFSDFFTSYFYNNLFLYSSQKASIGNRLMRILQAYGISFASVYPTYLLLIVGFIYVYKHRLFKSRYTILVIVMYVITCFFLFFGGIPFFYYSLPLACLAIFGILALDRLVDEVKFFEKFKKYTNKLIIASIPLSIFSCFLLNEDGWYAFRSRSSYPVLEMADIINNYKKDHDNVTLLSYETLDVGLYLTTDTIPNCKYFCGLNIPLEDLSLTQDRYVENGEVTFIVMRNNGLDPKYDKYELIYEKQGYSEFEYLIYYLYQLKE